MFRASTIAYGMEGTMDMISNASNSTAAASAPHNHQQEEAVLVSSSTKKAKAAQQAGGSGEPKPRRPQQDAALCPRCTSKNTKFCYYNNYNLNQPRHFCKNCRRYWTLGGTLRHVPVGGSCRRNKRASGSSSSSAASSTAATSAEMDKTVRLMLTAASTMSMPPSPTTGLIPNDMLPTFTPTGGSGGLDLAMDDQDQQGFLPFAPLSLSDDQAPEELAPGGGDTTPTLLDMLTGGFFEGVGSSSNYGCGLEFDMGGASNGMDMSFLLPEMETSATDPMQTQLLEGMETDDVEGELLWASYINDDGGYAASPAAGVEQQQQVAGDQQQEEDDKGKESSINNDGDGGSSEYSYWINNTNDTDGAEG